MAQKGGKIERRHLYKKNHHEKWESDIAVKVKRSFVPEWKGREESDWDEERDCKSESEAVRKMGVGGFCRHGALRPTPVPSALTYFQSGFYLDQTQALAKRCCLICLCGLFLTAGVLKRFQPPSQREVHYFEDACHVYSQCPHDELNEFESKWHAQAIIRASVMDTIELVNS